MFKECFIRIASKNKQRSSNHSVRSARFMRKWQDDVPRINQKAVEFHNLFQMVQKYKNHIPSLETFQGFQPHINQPQIKEKERIKLKMEQKRSQFLRSQNLFKNYMKRRGSLTITKRSFDFNQKTPQKNQLHNNIQNNSDVCLKNTFTRRTKTSMNKRSTNTNTSVSSNKNTQQEDIPMNVTQSMLEQLNFQQVDHQNQHTFRLRSTVSRRNKKIQ